MSLSTMLRAGPAIRLLVLAAAGLALAACGDDAATSTTATAPTTTPAPMIGVQLPDPAGNMTDLALLAGDWAPDAATCSQGIVLTVGNRAIGGNAVGAAQCTIDSRTREGDSVTVVANCTSPEAAFGDVTMTLHAMIVGEQPPTTMTLLQLAQGLPGNAVAPVPIIRCPIPTAVP